MMRVRVAWGALAFVVFVAAPPAAAQSSNDEIPEVTELRSGR